MGDPAMLSHAGVGEIVKNCEAIYRALGWGALRRP